MHIPDFKDVLLAQRQIRPYLARTPLYSYPAINALIDTEVYIKDDWTPVKIGE
jgi:threonine dehydratase